MSRYLPDLTNAELRALQKFLLGRKSVTELEVDEFMRDHYLKFNLFENCIAHVTQKDLVIKRPIGYKRDNK
jgi:hypothetical protein